MNPIGRVIGTERKPNTAYTFSFWTNLEAKLGIGTIVKVKAGEATVYGTVIEAFGFNDLESPLHEYLSVGGDANLEPPTERPEMRVFHAAVLRRDPEEPVSAVPIGEVFEADDEDLKKALRTDEYAEAFGIPAGCYGTDDKPMPVHLHSSFLLGPESGHLNMTGTSGLAAKTSFILFLLKSIFTHYKEDPAAPGAKGVAALLFNTKGGDLLYLDCPPEPGELSEKDLGRYEACGIDPTPFDKVRYYAPLTKGGAEPNSLRRNEELESGSSRTMPLTFGLREVLKHAEVLLNRDDLDAKADAYLAYLNERYVERESPVIPKQPEKERADSLDKLCEIAERHLRYAEENNGLDSHHPHTIRKMVNRLRNLGRRFPGLIDEKGEPQGPLQDHTFEPGTVYVLDVAQLASDEQDLVFAAVITKLRERMEDNSLGVGKLVVMVDELNKYAPSGGAETYVVKSLKEIASRGRYLGLTLFGAQQFRSRVDKEIVGNAASHAFGHVETEELAQPGYSYFSPAVKEKLGALPPGEILIKHPHFAQPIFIRFPKPACLKGSQGMKRYPREQGLPLRELLIQEVCSRGANRNVVIDALEGLAQDDKSLSDVLYDVRRTQNREEALAKLKKGNKLPPQFEKPEPKRGVPEIDPFA
jgi:uncharacterized protein